MHEILAIACDEDKQVAAHFGRCQQYVLFDVEDKKLVSSRFLPYPGHQPAFLPAFLAAHHVTMIIAGGMGQKAIELFNQHQINVIVGVNGNVKSLLDLYLAGKIQSKGQACAHPSHACES